jgi:hypothetical protein
MKRSDRDRAIAYIAEDIEIHERWTSFVESGSDEASEARPVVETAGDASHHGRWIDRLSLVLRVLRSRNDDDPGRAADACRDYEHWASEITRLTAEIVAVECPEEREPDIDEAGALVEAVDSCFRRAREDSANWTPGGPEDPPHPPTLATIAKAVASCPECSRLCVLIAERKHARQRFGVAKRAVRSVGKRAGREVAGG